MKNKGYSKFVGGGEGGKQGALWEMWKWRIQEIGIVNLLEST